MPEPGPASVRVVRPRNGARALDALDAALDAGASALLLHPRLTHAEVDAATAHLPADGLEAPRVVLATSGSTGAPKLIAHDPRRLRAAARAQARHLGFTSGDAWATALPVTSAGGLLVPLRARAAGAGYHLWERWRPHGAVEDMRLRGITHLSVTPPQLHDLLAHDPPPSLACVLVGGGPSLPVAEAARARGWPVAPGYGATEAPATIAALPPGADDPHGPSYGPPVPGVEVRVGDAGEIQFRSPHQAVARLENGKARPLGADGWVAPGDVGRVDAAGHLHVHGRADRAVLVGGMTVDPAEVEAALAAHPDVRTAAVVALPHPRLGHVLGAAVEAAGVGAAELRLHVEERLAPPKWPKRLAAVDELPRLATGKVDPEGVRRLLLGKG